MRSLKTLLYLKFYESFSANRNMICGLEEMYRCELPCEISLTEFFVLASKIEDYIFGIKIHSED